MDNIYGFVFDIVFPFINLLSKTSFKVTERVAFVKRFEPNTNWMQQGGYLGCPLLI